VVALENARLFDETQRLFQAEQQRAAELAIINSVQAGLANKLDMQAIYDLVGDKVRELFDAQAVIIRSYDPLTNLATCQYSIEKGVRNYPPPTPPGPIAREMLRTLEPVLLRNADDVSIYVSAPNPGTLIPKSGVYVPLLVTGDFKGWITL